MLGMVMVAQVGYRWPPWHLGQYRVWRGRARAGGRGAGDRWCISPGRAAAMPRWCASAASPGRFALSAASRRRPRGIP